MQNANMTEIRGLVETLANRLEKLADSERGEVPGAKDSYRMACGMAYTLLDELDGIQRTIESTPVAGDVDELGTVGGLDQHPEKRPSGCIE